jgi:hypothetical protein
MTERKCANCRHWTANKHIKTPLEAWEADKRPERPKGFLGALRWLWDPQQYRGDKPGTSGDSFDRALEMLEQGRAELSNSSGRCRRFPRSVETSRYYGCGEFEQR